MLHSTNYFDTFISVSPDSPAEAGLVPRKADSVAGMQHALLFEAPYAWTSDDLLFEILARRKNITELERLAARAEYFSKGQPCLRASPLVKQYGWGLHYDDQGRIALYGLEGSSYAELAKRTDLRQLAGMRSSRA